MHRTQPTRRLRWLPNRPSVCHIILPTLRYPTDRSASVSYPCAATARAKSSAGRVMIAHLLSRFSAHPAPAAPALTPISTTIAFGGKRRPCVCSPVCRYIAPSHSSPPARQPILCGLERASKRTVLLPPFVALPLPSLQPPSPPSCTVDIGSLRQCHRVAFNRFPSHATSTPRSTSRQTK